MIQRMERVGLGLAPILLPRADIDLKRWSTIACDQHTANPDYWSRVEAIVGSSPSTLRLIVPEIYLDQLESRRSEVTATARRYLSDGTLEERDPCWVLVDRTLPSGKRRIGLLAPVDLSRYNLDLGGLIQPTEETIESRLPARVSIRRGALLDMPHIIVLVNDSERRVFAPLLHRRDRLERLYDTELMADGGAVSGYALSSREDQAHIVDRLEELSASQRAAGGEESLPLYMAGDGNHSLAAARRIWSQDYGGDLSHPSRYALVELINLYDPALHIEPIHRVIFACSPERLWDQLREHPRWSGERLYDANDAIAACREANETKRRSGESIRYCGFISKTLNGMIAIDSDDDRYPAEHLEQRLIMLVTSKRVGERPTIDYIHGDDELARLGEHSDSVGLLYPPIETEGLFRRVVRSGPLPRKMFSLGSAAEKRYYLEARRIG